MLTEEPRTATQQLMRTDAGRTIAVSRYAPEILPGPARIVLDTTHEPYDADAVPDLTARIASVSIEVTAPGLPPGREAALLAVVRHCTVKNTLDDPPKVTLSLGGIRRSGAS